MTVNNYHHQYYEANVQLRQTKYFKKNQTLFLKLFYFSSEFGCFLCRLHTKCVATYRCHFSHLASSASSASHFFCATHFSETVSWINLKVCMVVDLDR